MKLKPGDLVESRFDIRPSGRVGLVVTRTRGGETSVMWSMPGPKIEFYTRDEADYWLERVK